MVDTLLRTVNGHISDLFFNLDHSDAKITEADGTFVGWDREKMYEQARWFHEAIEYIMYEDPPSIEAILNDFHRRV